MIQNSFGKDIFLSIDYIFFFCLEYFRLWSYSNVRNAFLKRVGNDIINRLRRKRAKPFFTKFCHHQRENKREVTLNKIVCVNTNFKNLFPFLLRDFSRRSSLNFHQQTNIVHAIDQLNIGDSFCVPVEKILLAFSLLMHSRLNY